MASSLKEAYQSALDRMKEADLSNCRNPKLVLQGRHVPWREFEPVFGAAMKETGLTQSPLAKIIQGNSSSISAARTHGSVPISVYWAAKYFANGAEVPTVSLPKELLEDLLKLCVETKHFDGARKILDLMSQMEDHA